MLGALLQSELIELLIERTNQLSDWHGFCHITEDLKLTVAPVSVVKSDEFLLAFERASCSWASMS